MSNSNNEFLKFARQVIPGGSQLFSKNPDLYAPNARPGFYEKAKGCEIWDIEGNKYIDMCNMSVGACVLGYANPEVDNHVISGIKRGVISSLNCPEEAVFAHKLLQLHPWADKVRFTRSGGEALSLAVRIARGSSGKSKILCNSYHGWHDWYLSINIKNQNNLSDVLMPGLAAVGVPKELLNTAESINIKDNKDYKSKLEKQIDIIGGVIIEPYRYSDTDEEDMVEFINFCKHYNVPIILDEITTGYRKCAGGSHRRLDVTPDICVLGKAISNGYAMAAVIGSKDMMEIPLKSFISSSAWAERIGPIAGLATLKAYESHKVERKIEALGNEMIKVWKTIFSLYNYKIRTNNIPSLPMYSITHERSDLIQTVINKELLNHNMLTSNIFRPTLAHSNDHIDQYKIALEAVLKRIQCKPDILNKKITVKMSNYVQKY